MSGGNAELLEVQEKLKALNADYDKLNDEWTGRLAAQNDEFQREKHNLLQDSSARLQAAKEHADAKNAEIVSELDKFRRAFTGDPLGWAAATDEQGKPYYYNSETGESDYDKPRILEIAEVMNNIDSLDEGKKKQEKAIKKGKEAELQARKLEVSLNEVRGEAAALRKTKKEWEACGTAVTSLCEMMSTAMDETDSRVTKVEEGVRVVTKANEAVKVATKKIEQQKRELFERGLRIEQLTRDLATAGVEVEQTRDRANKLEEKFTQAVEERVDEVKLPLEDELAAAYAGRQEEKALRESDRRYLANLWPEGWLVPSILRRFRTMTPEERAQQTLKMEELEAERDLVEAIRAGVAAAAKWETKADDYGRTYYANWESGEAVYDPPPEMRYRPPLGRNELGEKVDPRLQALREWEQGTDGWGKPFWQNSRSGDVVQTEPKGWSEAMGLGEHELEGWEGPTQDEVSRDVAVEAARVVITWLNKAKEAEEKRTRKADEPLTLEDGSGEANDESSDEDDEDQDEFVYDIQSVEELAMGDEGWCYQGPANSSNEEEGIETNAAVQKDKRDRWEGAPADVAEIRSIIVRLARREDRFERRLKLVRRNLEDLAHDLLAAKRLEELEVHDFALGLGASGEGTARSQDVKGNMTAPTVVAGNTKELADAGAVQGVDESPGGGNTTLSSTDVASADIATAVTNAADARDTSGDGGVYEEIKKERTTDDAAIGSAVGGEQTNEDDMVIAAAGAASTTGGDTATAATEPAGSGPRTTSSNGEGDRDLETAAEQATTQAAGEAAAEPASGGSRGSNRTDHEGSAEEQLQVSSAIGEEERSSPSLPNLSDPTKLDEGDVTVGVEEVTEERFSNPSKTLPDTLAQEIGDRAFPLARASEEQEGGSSGGVSCAAFHALAAEAVWAGLNGSNHVQKPPQSVWDPRGGDRWGTAAFFAEQIGKREEEVAPGLPRRTKTRILRVDNDNGDGSGSGSDGGGGSVGDCSGEHPLPGSSSRHAAARALCMGAMSSRRGFFQQAAEAAAQEARQRLNKVVEVSAATNPISLGASAHTEADGSADLHDETGASGMIVGRGGSGCLSKAGDCDDEAQDEPVIQSAVMLRFGAEIPSLVAAGKCGRAVQFSIPDDWNNPEAQEKQYAGQMARRKETMEMLRQRDEAPLARPRGYDPNSVQADTEGSRRRGCQDARELLRYEAVVLEEALHQTLVDINETQGLLEEGRAQAAARWKDLVEAEEMALAGLAFDASRQQAGMAKMAMEIRGLRVPLIEPQPPSPPTLDPGRMVPPSLVPDAEKMRQDEVDVFSEKIRGGDFDHGEPILLPEGKTMSSKQLREITTVISQRQAEVVILLEEETLRYNDAMGVYEYNHREWERLEVERKERLSVTCHQSRLDHLNLDSLAALTRSHTEHLKLLTLEASADQDIALQSQEANRRFEATLAKEIAEEARAHEWLPRLQVGLSDALRDKEALERLPDAALNRLDTLRWEERRAGRMIECRRRVAELRESLVEEGRRRRQLYEERKWVVQSEFRRLLAERAAVGEKEGMIRLLVKVGHATLVAQRSTFEARKKEAAEDKDGVGTEGTVSPGEVYSAHRDWVSEEFQEAAKEQKRWEEKLTEMVRIRELARRRETTVGELVLGAARGALPAPHPDQWLPKAEKQRHEDEVRLLLGRHARELRVEQEAVESSCVRVREAARDVAILKAKLGAIEDWRDHEILTLRTAGKEAVESLKGLLEKQRKESAARIDKLEQALSELRKEYNEVRAELTARIEQLNRGRSNTEAWVKALRHDLAQERAKREAAEDRLAIVTDRARVLSEKLRTELRAERMHSLRLELWIAALHDEIRFHIKTQEEMRRLQALERVEHERQKREERHKVWRHRTAIRLLCTSVDSLFLFFAQRLANLAGSRRTHNDALRANGAVEVLAAVCRGPRKDLRRLAARALGALGWNGHTEARVLAWDIYRHWDLWVQSCCPAEEARLLERGRAFDGPEEFRHADQISAPPSPSPASAWHEQASRSPNSPPLLSKQRGPEKATKESFSCSIEDDLADNSAVDESGQRASSSGDGQGGQLVTEATATATATATPEAGRLGGVGEDENQEHGSAEKNEGERVEEEEEEFRPRAAMSARAVVRERRQWALRRARRQEGPNEANQLELGGWSPAGTGVPEAWVDTVVKVAGAGRRGAKGGGGGGGGGEDDIVAEGSGRGGGGGVVALLTRLCRERDDWEVVRAAASALSVAAYHEDNADRMGKAAPDLIPVLASLLPHPDPEVQTHAATALANLAFGSPSYQSEAGEAGAVKSLLDVCRGRADMDAGDVGHRDGTSGGGTPLVASGIDKDGVDDTAEGGGGNRGRSGGGRSIPSNITTNGRGRSESGEDEAGGVRGEVQRVGRTKKEREPSNKRGQGATAECGEQEEHMSSTDEANAEKAETRDVGAERETKVGCEGNKGLIVARRQDEEEGGVEDEGGEEGGAAATMDVDAVQAATAALANLLCYSEANAVRLVAAGGIGVLVGLVSSYKPHNLLDFDQAEEIQANAAEALVNATRNHGDEVTVRIHSLGISPLVLMCGSHNLQVQRHAALVIGNVCQTDVHRATAGEEGAAEALFALCDTNDDVVRANALWALGNLAWDPHNQERIGRYISQLLALASSSWLPIRTNALICLGNSLFFHEANRRRLEAIDEAVLTLLGYCDHDHPAPVQEAALRCLVSLTYVDRIVAPLVDAGCIALFVSSLSPSVPTAVRHPAALALLNVSVHDLYKSHVAEAGGVEAAVALLGSDNPEERELAAKILAALACTEADDEDSGKKQQLDLPHLLGIVQTKGNLTAQKAAAEQIAQEVSQNPSKQRSLGESGGLAVLLGMCDHNTEAPLLVPVLWGLRSCLHGNDANKNRFVRAGGLEALVQLCHSSRSAGEWSVAEGVLTTLVTAATGNEKICRRLLRVGLDQLIDAAEDSNNTSSYDTVQDEPASITKLSGAKHAGHRSKTAVWGGTPPPSAPPGEGGQGMTKKNKCLPAMPGVARASPLPGPQSAAGPPRGPATDGELGLDKIDEIGVDGVLREDSEALALRMQAESRETCSALATSLLQALGPFNYVICGHCGAREKGGTTCSQCGYAIKFDLSGQDEDLPILPRTIDATSRARAPVAQGS